MITWFCFELRGYVRAHYLVLNFFLDPVTEIIELSRHRINTVWWRHHKKTVQIQSVNQNPLVTAGVMWSPASPHQCGGGEGWWYGVLSPVLPYRHDKDLGKVRFTENKVHFRRKWAMLGKVEALWNLGDEETREYAPKGRAPFQQGEL